MKIYCIETHGPYGPRQRGESRIKRFTTIKEREAERERVLKGTIETIRKVWEE